MTKIPLEEAQAKLPELIHELPPGEELIITGGNLAVARLTSTRSVAARRLGSLQGTVTYIAPDFDDPLDDFAGYHRDPFDRLLVAHALVENAPVLSFDPIFDRYGIGRFW